MRYCLTVALLLSPLSAQDQPPATVIPNPPAPKSEQWRWVFPNAPQPKAPAPKPEPRQWAFPKLLPKPRAGTLAINPAAKACAIPLTNVLKGKVAAEPMPRVIPPPKKKFAADFVAVPAPSCDDGK